MISMLTSPCKLTNNICVFVIKHLNVVRFHVINKQRGYAVGNIHSGEGKKAYEVGYNRHLKIDVYVKRQTASEVFDFTTLL